MPPEENMEQNELGTKRIPPLVMKMAFPLIIAQLVNGLYNIVDRIYLGHLEGAGAEILTGVGITYPVILLITAFSNLIGNGGGPLAAIRLGQKETRKAEEILTVSATSLVVLSLLLMAVFYAVKTPLIYLFGASQRTFIHADSYLSIYLLGTPFVLLTLGLNPFISAQGKTTMSMLTVVIGAAANIILDPVFIFVFDMEAAGAAIATVISQMISGIYVVAFLSSRHSTMRLDIRKPVIRKKILLPIISLGVSPFIMSATEAAINIAFNTRLQSLGGDMAVGTMTIFSSILTFINMPITGMNQAITPLVSYNFGAALNERVRSIYRFAAAAELSYTLLASLLCNILPGIVIGLFTTDEALISYAIPYMKFFITGMSVFGLQCSAQNTFLGLGQARISLFLAIFRKIILLIPLVYILSATPLGITGVFLAESISDATAATVTSAVFLATLPGILRKGAPKP